MLNEFGIIVMDPCDKPYEGAPESDQERTVRRKLKAEGNLEAVAKIVRPIRRMDLRMVDVSDFVIASIDTSVHMCGSYEEITLANRQKKPVLCWVQQGRNETPDWLIGMLPTEFFFSTLEDVLSYLKKVDETRRYFKRWYVPRYDMLYNEQVLNKCGGV